MDNPPEVFTFKVFHQAAPLTFEDKPRWDNPAPVRYANLVPVGTIQAKDAHEAIQRSKKVYKLAWPMVQLIGSSL